MKLNLNDIRKTRIRPQPLSLDKTPATIIEPEIGGLSMSHRNPQMNRKH